MRCSLVVAATIALFATTPSHAQVPSRGAEMRVLARQVAAGTVERARSSERDGRPHEAEGLYRQALEQDGTYLAAYLGYARLLELRRHHDEALEILQRAADRAVQSEEDAVELARTREQLGDLEGAFALLTTRGPSAAALRAQAELASAHGRFPEALAAARRLSELVRNNPEDARTAEILARALARLVGEADPVRYPGPGAGTLRRLLAR